MSDRSIALRDFLRFARARRSPSPFGIPHGPRRRTEGLLSAEVAELIGVSVTWYRRFEAGRARMSIKTLSRLADTLHSTRPNACGWFISPFPKWDG